jgi:hypothetical protein
MNIADSFQNGTYPSWELLDQFQAAACKDPTKLGLKPAVCIFIPKFPAHHLLDYGSVSPFIENQVLTGIEIQQL